MVRVGWMVAVAAFGAAPLPGEVIKTVAVEPQVAYELTVESREVEEGALVRLVFLDESGLDVAPREASLGFETSGGVVNLPPEGGSVSLASRAGNGTLGAVRARIELEGAPRSALRVCELRRAAADEDPAHTAGIDGTATGTGAFATNLLGNASFEEADGWRYVGPGEATFSSDSYAGARAARLTVENDGGRWESDPFPVDATRKVRYTYALKYARVSRPHGHPDPVRLEFLKRRKDGSFARVPSSLKEFRRYVYWWLRGEWAVIRPQPVDVPKGATHACVVVEHRDKTPIWSGTAIANWGTILADNVAVWQGEGLPPRLPIGRTRENSVDVVQDGGENGATSYAEAKERPVLRLKLENLLAYDRELHLTGTVRDLAGETVDSFDLAFALAPFEACVRSFDLPVPSRYGCYPISFEVKDAGGVAGHNEGAFAYLRHPSGATAADKASGFYPFDLHTGYTGIHKRDPKEVTFEARMMERMGVRGVRVQTGLNLLAGGGRSIRERTAEDLVASAAAAVAAWRAEVVPILRRHGIRSWCSLMEQGKTNLGGQVKTAEDFAKYEAMIAAFARAVGDDAEFVLFGNEGVGGYTAHLGDDEDLFPLSAFRGTTRDWMKVARSTVATIRRVRPDLPVGLAHASDWDGLISKRFLTMAEGGFDVDCWGVNSYVAPERFARAVGRNLGEERLRKFFYVIPELGENVSTPQKAANSCGKMLEHYLMTTADAPWVKHIAWFLLQDPLTFGMFDLNSHAPRATSVAYAVMTDTLRAGRPDKRVKLSGGEFIRWRRLDGTSVAGAWSSAKAKVVFAVPAGATLVRTDLFGNEETIPAKDGRAEVTLGRAAYYALRGTGNLDLTFAVEPVDEIEAKRIAQRRAFDAAVAAGSPNLVRNAAFEGTGAGIPSEWTAEITVGKGGHRLPDTRLVREPKGGPDGTAALFIDNRVKDTLKSGSTAVFSQEVPVEPGATYGFRVLMRSVRSGTWFQPQIDLLDADGKVCRRCPTTESNDEGDWKIRETSFTVLKGEKTARILLKSNNGGIGAALFANPELRKTGK